MNDAQPSKAFTALLEQVEFVLTVTVPMTHQQEEAWPELRKRAKAARAAALSAPASSGASETVAKAQASAGDVADAAARLMNEVWVSKEYGQFRLDIECVARFALNNASVQPTEPTLSDELELRLIEARIKGAQK